MKRKIALILSLVLLLGALCLNLPSCSQSTVYSEGEGELNVLCTTFAPFDFTREVGGDRVTVSILQDSGADLHNYTPTAATLEAISQADIFIYVGGTSDENWVHDALAAAGNSSLVTLCLMDYVEPQYAHLENDWSEHAEGDHDDHHGHDEHHGHDHGADEHVWTSVKNAAIMVDAIKDTLSSVDPEGATAYSINAEVYKHKLSGLDSELSEISEGISMMLFADRFPFVYLLHDYHIPYKAAFSGCSTETNSGFEIQVDLIKAVREQSLPCIFVIEGGDKQLAEAVAAETGCKIYSLNSMQSVNRSDIQDGASYLTIMQQNINTLRGAYYGTN